MKVRPAYTLLPLTVPSVISRCLLSLPSSPHLVSAAQTSQIIGIRLLSFNIPAVNSALCILTRRHSHRTWWWWHLVGFLLQRFHWKWHIFHLNVKTFFSFFIIQQFHSIFFAPCMWLTWYTAQLIVPHYTTDLQVAAMNQGPQKGR